MEKKYYDVSKVVLGKSGRVELNEAELAELEKKNLTDSVAGGQYLSQFQPIGINWFRCNESKNAGENCTNGWSCRRSSNVDHCKNVKNCDGGKNSQVCSK
jgi:hypothetical protein